jgi:hypothetical protein
VSVVSALAVVITVSASVSTIGLTVISMLTVTGTTLATVIPSAVTVFVFVEVASALDLMTVIVVPERRTASTETVVIMAVIMTVIVAIPRTG